uniref:GDNF family receptor alpha like n=1 Tax=Varanus komodoensis TaxID=61221 RepID=A0A8D2IHR4_VARKO
VVRRLYLKLGLMVDLKDPKNTGITLFALCNRCTVKESMNCNKIIQFLVEQFPEFKDCICTKDNCSIKMLFGKECFSTKDHMKIKSQWKLSALSDYEYKHRRSCFQVNVQCVDDTVCNRQLSRYLQACQVNGTHCNVNRCQAALQVFYENMPFNVAQMLAFCDCMEADESCHKAKGVLHGTPCAVRMVPPPSCLHVIHTCQTNSLCWGKYKTFTSKCLMQISQPCLEDKACLESLDTNSLVCSDSAECRAAYVGMRGSLLQVECTCETTSAAQESMCRQFQHILHSNSCFSRLRTSAHLLFIYCPTSWRFQVALQSLTYNKKVIQYNDQIFKF